MKTKLLFLLACISLMLINSCTKEELTSFKITNPEKLIQDFNENRNLAEAGTYLEGRTYIRSAEDNRLAIFVESSNLESSLFYVLQIEDLKEKTFEKNIQNAQIFFFQNSLLINSLDEDLTFLFSTNENPDIGRITKNISNTWKGFGLGIHEGFDIAQVISSTSFDNGTLRDSEFGNPGGPVEVSCSCKRWYQSDSGCTNGGAGSDGCSISDSSGEGCSVSCSEGNFGCCS